MNKKARTAIWYGETGTAKTSAIGCLARYIYETTGKPTRLISADGGGWDPIQDLVEAGVIQALDIKNYPNPLPLLRTLQRGLWPVREVMDPITKKLREMDLEDSAWLKYMSDTSAAKGLIGAYAIEGITSISHWVMRDLVNKGRKISEEVVGQFIEDNEKFAAAARSHYGMVHNIIIDLIVQMPKLPVEYVVFTAHEGKGEDDISRQLVYGPASVGKALTDKLPPMVGDLFHFWSDEDKAGNQELRVYWKRHKDPKTQTFWPAKVRLRPAQIEEFSRNPIWKDGWMVLRVEGGEYKVGVHTILRELDRLAREGSEAAEKWKKEQDEKRSQSQLQVTPTTGELSGMGLPAKK